jgi:DNA-binding transcriptional LysR family regulator
MEKLDPLQTFIEVVRSGSFTAAARALSMPRSTVSLHIRTLETALGARLLKRSTRSLSLTEDGDLLFSHAKDGLQSLIAAMDMVRGQAHEFSGLIRVTAPADFPTETLATAISTFRTDHPAVRFDVVLTNAALDLIGDNVDVALRMGVRGDLERVERKLAPVDWQFCAGADWINENGLPENLKDITEFISPASDLRLFLERFVLGGRELPTGMTTADNQLMIRDLALSGSGVALLPTGLCRDLIKAGRLITVLPDIPIKAPVLNLTFPSRSDITPRVRAFADALAAQFT